MKMQEVNVGKNIKIIMAHKGLSATQLAKISGVSQPSIYGITAGTHSPSVKTVTKIAKALDVDLQTFFKKDLLNL
jgi:transcriptional regulator with XRE-family HTH domain